MSNLGRKIRNLRIEQKIPLRKVSAFLDIDQALLSKIERGQRRISREQLTKLTEFFKIEESEMVIEWLSEKILYEINEEDLALEAIHLAENRLEYLAFQKIDRGMLKQQLVSTISRFDAIKSAWIYGSFSRGDDGPKSDIDLAINVDKGFSYFDLAEVQFHLELETKRKIDIGFLDSFKPHILAHVKPDLKIIYERDPS